MSGPLALSSIASSLNHSYGSGVAVEIKKTQVLALGLDLIVGVFFALVCAVAFHLILFLPFGVGVLLGFLLYGVFRVLGWLGERSGLDV